MSTKQKLVDTYNDNYEKLLRIAVAKVRSLDAAYDVLQNLAVRIMEFDREVDIEEYEAYLSRAVRHAACDYIRKESKYVPTEPEILKNCTPDEFNEMASRFESRESLEKYLKGLSTKTQEAWIRHLYDGETIEHIAKDMHMNPATLRQQFRRIRARIPKDILLLTMLYSIIR